MQHPTRILLLVALGLGVSASASGPLSCDDIQRMMGEGTGRAKIVSMLAASGVADAEGYVDQCLSSPIDEDEESDVEVEASEEKAAGDSIGGRMLRALGYVGSRAAPDVADEAEAPRPSPRKTRSVRPISAPAGAAVAAPPPMRQERMKKEVRAEDPMGTEQYTDYGRNAETLTAEDNQSTFAVDVDTASYTISRRKLTEGTLPPASAVRVEEFVNWVPYDYAPPKSGSAPFAVHLEAAANPFMDGHHVLRVGVKGKELEGERAPVHLTFLVDTSGSMGSHDKLPMAQRALHHLVDNLDVEDTIALATYAGHTAKILGPTPITQKGRIHQAIDQLSSGGGTAMSSGMELAYQMASESYLHGSENRVVVLSDGDANIGRTGHEDMLRTIRNHAEEGITLTTVGFGMGNYKDTMMEQIANQGDGNYFYIDTFNEAKKVFGTDLSGTIQTIARDVKIQVEFDAEKVWTYRLIGYENRDIADRDFRNDAVDAGEIGTGHSVTALYDVVLNKGARGALATVRLRAKTPGPDRPAREWRTSFEGSPYVNMSDATPDLRVAFATATFADKLRGNSDAAEVSYAALAAMVERAGRGFEEDADLVANLRRASALSGEAMARR
jgi:Ca-activated chloride channel homolog